MEQSGKKMIALKEDDSIAEGTNENVPPIPDEVVSGSAENPKPTKLVFPLIRSHSADSFLTKRRAYDRNDKETSTNNEVRENSGDAVEEPRNSPPSPNEEREENVVSGDHEENVVSGDHEENVVSDDHNYNDRGDYEEEKKSPNSDTDNNEKATNSDSDNNEKSTNSESENEGSDEAVEEQPWSPSPSDHGEYLQEPQDPDFTREDLEGLGDNPLYNVYATPPTLYQDEYNYFDEEEEDYVGEMDSETSSEATEEENNVEEANDIEDSSETEENADNY